MRKLVCITALMLAMAAPMVAQEAECEIDLTSVETLLQQAHVAVTDGDTSGALDLIAEMQTALDSISVGCMVTTLSEHFEAPDGSFSFDYPEDWTLGEYISEGDELSTMFVGNNADVVAEGGANEPSLESGEQLIGFLFGSLTEITGGTDDDTLESVITALTELFKSQYPNISSAEYFSHNDHRASRFEFGGGTFEAVILVIEYRQGASYMAVVGVSAPHELDALRPVVDAIAGTIRVEGRL